MLGITRGDVDSDPMGCARRAASQFGATVLLKGGTQYVATESGTVTIAVRGPAWTGQAGSGDTLAGMCGTLLAAGLGAERAALLGASLQAITASRYPGPQPPDVLASHFPAVIANLVDVNG